MKDPTPTEEATVQQLERAEQLKLSGNHQEALEILEQLLIEDPCNVAALEEITDNELSLGNRSRAQRAAKQAIELDAGSYTAHYLLGCLYAQKEQWKKALPCFKQANELRPNDTEILRCLGWALFSGGQRVQGIVTLERSLNIERDNPFVLCDLGAAYLQIRNFNKARPLLERALDIDPNNKRARKCVDVIKKMEHTTSRAQKV